MCCCEDRKHMKSIIRLKTGKSLLPWGSGWEHDSIKQGWETGREAGEDTEEPRSSSHSWTDPLTEASHSDRKHRHVTETQAEARKPFWIFFVKPHLKFCRGLDSYSRGGLLLPGSVLTCDVMVLLVSDNSDPWCIWVWFLCVSLCWPKWIESKLSAGWLTGKEV